MTSNAPDLESALRRQTRRAAPELVKALRDDWVRCYACGHTCKIPPGRQGICRVRFNEAGALRVPYGYVATLMCDPIEKKPFFHALPGSQALSFGMLGCDLHCAYCRNWVTSQALRDPNAIAPTRELSAAQIARLAVERGASMLASTYNEPLITAEWAVGVFRDAKQRGLRTAFISNGNGTQQVLRFLRPWVDLYKVDLKSFRDRSYRALGGRIERILQTIPELVRAGFWVEVVTLVIPGFNDTDAELRDIACYLADVSPDIPWHVTAFRKDYRMTQAEDTSAATLVRGCQIGREAGLRYTYAGNLPGRVGRWENTHCPGCDAAVIERTGHRMRVNRLLDGRCPECATLVAGVWS